MSKDFEVQSIHRKYTVAFDSYKNTLKDNVLPGDIVLIDSNVEILYPDIVPLLDHVHLISIEANEQAKTYEAIGGLLKTIIESGFSKNNRLIAIGGGVIQDATAFAASILFRGVEWLFFPTNLLTQCDSCIGSKTSVNCGDYKNQLGGFYPPSKIIIDLEFCRTLSEKEIDSGLGEMLHYFLVDGSTDLDLIQLSITAAKKDFEVLSTLVHQSLMIKRSMVEVDEFDQGLRNVFNYGHSFGHALEATTDFSVPHGIAVTFGMDLANLISARLGLISMDLRNSIRTVLSTVWEGTDLPEIDIDRYYSALSKDKKNIGNEIKVILTRGLGDMFKTTLEWTPEIRSLIHDYFAEGMHRSSL